MEKQPQDMIDTVEGDAESETLKPRRTWTARIMRLVLWLVILLLISIAGAGAWLATGKRSFSAAKSYILPYINEQAAPYTVNARDISIWFDMDRSQFVLGLEALSTFDAEQNPVIVLPRVLFNVDGRALLSGKVKIRELALLKPHVSLRYMEDGGLSLSLDAGGDDFTSSVVDVADEIVDIPADTEPAAKGVDEVSAKALIALLRAQEFETLVMRDANLQLHHPTLSPVTLHTPELRIAYMDAENFPAIGVNMQLQQFGGEATAKPARLAGALVFDDEGRFSRARLKFAELQPNMIANFDQRLQKISALKMPLSGEVSAQFAEGNVLDNLEVSFVGKNGVLEDDTIFELPIELKGASLKVQATNALKDINIEALNLTFARGSLELVGDVKINPEPVMEEGGASAKPANVSEPKKATDELRLAVNATATARNVPVDDIRLVWPKILAPVSRAWVVKNISHGMVPEAVAKIKISPDDNLKRLPPEFIDASVNVKDAHVNYLRKFPKVVGVDGVAHFSGKGMKVTATSGTTMETATLEKGIVAIPDFFEKGAPMQVDLKLQTEAKNVANLLSEKYLHIAPEVNFDEKTITGKVNGDVMLRFPLYSGGGKYSFFDYNITANLVDVSQNQILNQWDIDRFSGRIKANNDALSLEGKMLGLQGIPATLTVQDRYGKNAQTFYHFIANVPDDKFTAFRMEIPEFITGTVGVDAKVYEGEDDTRTEAKLNLEKSVVDLPILKWKKEAGVPALAQLTMRKKDGKTFVNDLNLHTYDLDARGNIVASAEHGLEKMSLSRFRFSGSEAALDYSIDGEQQVFAVRGSVFDVSRWVGDDETNETKAASKKNQSDENPLDIFNGLRLDLNVEKLKLGKKRVLSQVTGHIDCRFAKCTTAAVTGFLPSKKPVHLTIGPKQGKRYFELKADDAGQFLAFLDVSDHVQGGQMTLKAFYEDTAQPGPLVGRLLMGDFRLQNAPMLTKLLSVGSLTGLVDTLKGNGVAFKKLGADVRYQNGVFKVGESKAYGDALGITAKGTVAPFSAAGMSLSGTVVPAYSANAIIGKIPVLGDIITGGDGAIIGINYSVKGSVDDPDVSVNPLSLLAPGFLKKLFEAP